MKNIIKIVTLLCIYLGVISTSFAYELTDKDYQIIDNLDKKIFNLIDTKENISPEKVVLVIDEHNKKITNIRISSILTTIVDDIKYFYYLDEYKDEKVYQSSKDDCFEGELYDEEGEYCYVEDSGEGVEYNEYLNKDFNGSYDLESKEEGDNEESTLNATYKINGNNIKLISGIDDKKYRDIWNIFSVLIPKEYRLDFENFNVNNDEDGDTFAYVIQNKENNKKWDLGVNVAMFYENGKLDKKGSIHTLIHEFAHVLTLNKTQIQYIPSDTYTQLQFDRLENKCSTKFLIEGCLKKDSYFNKFIKDFWENNFKKSQNDESNDFYTGNELNFVSDYAATTPGEDIAETFLYFILKDKPIGETIADKKVLFMYDYEKLIILRGLIRNRLVLLK